MNRTHAEPADLAVDELKRRARRRLIGAIVLALAAAVALPLLFESEPKPLGEDVSIQIPPIDNGKFVNPLSAPATDGKGKSGPSAEPAARPDGKPVAPSARSSAVPPVAPASSSAAPVTAAVTASVTPSVATPAGSTPPGAGAAAAPSSPSAAKAVDGRPSVSGTDVPPVTAAVEMPKSAAREPAEKNDERATAATAMASGSTVAAKDARPAPKSAGGFVVQVAALADINGAGRLAGRLKTAGYPGYTEAFPTSHGAMQRVRVGPYPTREAADVARSKLKAAGFTGIVEPLK